MSVFYANIPHLEGESLEDYDKRCIKTNNEKITSEFGVSDALHFKKGDITFLKKLTQKELYTISENVLVFLYIQCKYQLIALLDEDLKKIPPFVLMKIQPYINYYKILWVLHMNKKN